MAREERWTEYNVSYPGFILSPRDNPNGGWVESREGRRWLLYFATQELAELYAEQIGKDFIPNQIDSNEHLVAMLADEGAIAGIVVNPVANQGWTHYIATCDL